MTDALVRPAQVGDIDDLVRMRADFTFEHGGPTLPTNPGYEDECRAFLEKALAGDRWQIWVAELDGAVVSHAYVALIDKVPRPGARGPLVGFLHPKAADGILIELVSDHAHAHTQGRH